MGGTDIYRQMLAATTSKKDLLPWNSHFFIGLAMDIIVTLGSWMDVARDGVVPALVLPQRPLFFVDITNMHHRVFQHVLLHIEDQ